MMMDQKNVQTIADIARLAGVSKSTVSRALNNSPLISDETKQRIQEIAKKHQYRINIPARNLSLQQSNTIAFVTHCYVTEAGYTIEDLFQLEILGAVTKTLLRHNYDLLIVSVDPHDPEWPHRYLDTGRVDGFILLTSTRKTYHIQTLVDMSAPFIVWGSPPEDASYSSISSDNYAGGRLAVDHLTKSGRQRIAFIGGPEYEVEAGDRFEGYADGLQAAGLALDPEIVTYGWYTSTSAAERVRHLLNIDPNLDAVFANSDMMASAVIRELQKKGRRVPEDVAVVGYDDLSIAAANHPSITTVRQNIPLVGKLLAENLLSFLENGEITTVTLPVELVIRESA
jgi:DNA-binding LacI/PurR family transcriptional regulator